MSSVRKQQTTAPQPDETRAVQIAKSSGPTEQLSRQQQQRQIEPANKTATLIKSDQSGHTLTSTAPCNEDTKLHATSRESSNANDTRNTKVGQQQQQRRHQSVQPGASTTGEANNNDLDTLAPCKFRVGARVDGAGLASEVSGQSVRESSKEAGRGLQGSSQGQSQSENHRQQQQQQQQNNNNNSSLKSSLEQATDVAEDRTQVQHDHHQQKQQQQQRDKTQDNEDKLTPSTPANTSASRAVIMLNSNKLSNEEHLQANKSNSSSSASMSNNENGEKGENPARESRVAGITSATTSEHSAEDLATSTSSSIGGRQANKPTTPNYQAPSVTQASGISCADSLNDNSVNSQSDKSNVLEDNRDNNSDNSNCKSNKGNSSQETISTTIDINNLKPIEVREANGQQHQQQQQQQLGKKHHSSHLLFVPETQPPAPATTLVDSTKNNTSSINNSNSICNSCNKNASHQQQQQHGDQFELFQGRSKRLGYFQSLLLRKWPCLAVAICIMSSLIFSILLSGLTIYLVHDATDCGHLAKFAAEAAAPRSNDLHGHYSPAAGSDASSAAARHHSNLIPADQLGPIEADQLDPLLSGRHLLSNHGASAGTESAGSSSNNKSVPFQRLPMAIVPEHYELFVWPHLVEPDFAFDGSVEIYVRCVQPTDNITLHTHDDLKLNESSISLIRLSAAKSGDDKTTTTKPAATTGPATTTKPAPMNGPVANGSTPTRLTRSAAAPVAASVAASHQVATGNGHADDELKRKSKPVREQDSVKVARVSRDKEMQYSIIHLDTKLEAGQDYLLRIDFVGILNDDLAGFYKMKYESPNSTEVTWIAATQFQATDARRAFPCLDEPLFKATFGIKIKHWKNMTALSNMPVVKSEASPDGLWITDTFAKTHKMSTYLVAMAVTNFASRSDGNITVWARPGMEHSAEFALKSAGKILSFYEDYFGIKYPLPKMDMIALPDFHAGAMENWGLITYRETSMLCDERKPSVMCAQNVAVVVAHELAHQWFGNLVTPKWWDDLWLNEGFASYIEYIGVNHIAPHWRMLDQFVIESTQTVFRSDALPSSHQISIPVDNPDEISEIFDLISYNKGASIIRMMNHILSEKVFKEGLRLYLNALKYSNSAQSDLWAYLSEAQQRSFQSTETKANNSTMNASNTNSSTTGAATLQLAAKPEMVNVERVMNSWTLQTGYPLVTLTRSYDTQANGPTGKLKQVRFEPGKLLEGNKTIDANSSSTGKESWEIPITFTWQSESNWKPETRLWMHSNQSEPVEIGRSLAPVPSNEWMLINLEQVGYYRVNYDLNNWKLLIDQLMKDHTKILPTNRAQLLDDLFSMARCSVLDYPLALEATKYLKSERDYLPWYPVLSAFGYIDSMLVKTPIYGIWEDYFAQLIKPYYELYKDSEWTYPEIGSKQQQAQSSGIISADIMDSLNQRTALLHGCSLNFDHCIKRCKDLFNEWRTKGQNNIKVDLRALVYSTAIEHGTRQDWDFLWKKYETEQDPTEKDHILVSLSTSKEMWILARYLEWAFDKTKPIRRQDSSVVFRLVASNIYGREVALNFLRERWPTIKEYYGKNSQPLGSMLKTMLLTMTTAVEIKHFKEFYETVKADVGTSKRSFQQAVETAEINLRWTERNYKTLENWLQKEQSSVQ